MELSYAIILSQTRGVDMGGGGANHICGVLPKGIENYGLPSAGIPSGGTEPGDCGQISCIGTSNQG